ncbi:MAG: NYN domain-containing protein [Pseudomonadota bacterium]|nr:NYN domain-containing protein [Pseudomonadota bacterium]
MERNLAVLIDFENIATGCEKEGLGRFDTRIVMRRLKDKGRISVARSYADWGRWNRFKLDLVHEGITMVELTSHGMQSKNRADIALAVDAMELAFTRSFVDTFVILSGDSDFTPLVMRLKELNKRVIGCGTRGSTSRLIAETCDEFFFYDTLRNESRLEPLRPPKPAPVTPPSTPAAVAAAAAEDSEEEEGLTIDEAFELLVETLENHQRDEPAPVHASVLKASMKRKEPTFSEVDLGMRTFARFLETAAQKGLVALSKDDRAGGVRVDLPQSTHEEPAHARPAPRTLGPDARRLQGMLAEAGLEIGEPRERRIIIEQFVATCAERARRNRTCAIQFVLGDLLRRCKQEAPDIAPRTVKAVAHALLRAGLLIHPNGEAARATTAAFIAPESATQLVDDLHAAGLRALVARGENPDDAVLTELFVGKDGEAPLTNGEGEAAPAEPATKRVREQADAGPRRGRDRVSEAPKREREGALERAPQRSQERGADRAVEEAAPTNGESRGAEARVNDGRPARRDEPRDDRRGDRRDEGRAGRRSGRGRREGGEPAAELGWPEVHPAALALVAPTSAARPADVEPAPVEPRDEQEPATGAALDAGVSLEAPAESGAPAEAKRPRKPRAPKKSAEIVVEAPAAAAEEPEVEGGDDAPAAGDDSPEAEHKRRRRGGRRGRRPAGATEPAAS